MPANNSIQAALAIASDYKRKRRAAGGGVHLGAITGPTPGRTDVHEMNLPEGSYVLPADLISFLGENNTEAGLKVADEVFGYKGTARARGGKVARIDAVPVITASGEFVIRPQICAEIGGGDVGNGHKILDAWVMDMRKKHIQTLAELPPPAQD